MLVDDDDGEAVELDRRLDQRVGADDESELARRELGQHVGPPRGRRRAREQRHRHQLAGHELGDGGEVLLGQRLGRRHQRGLHPLLDRAQQRVERDDGLARADVALQQPLHGNRAGEVDVDLAHRLLLVRRQREGQ